MYPKSSRKGERYLAVNICITSYQLKNWLVPLVTTNIIYY